jgi:ubiquinone/menaquinone biosynthesis C-methylase UbiE
MSESLRAESRVTVADAVLSAAAFRCAPRTSPASREAWRAVFGEVLGSFPSRILDVGSGAGEAAFLLHELGHYPHGLDKDHEAIRRARAAADVRCAAVPFHVGDAESLDLPAGAFDAVHARDVIGLLPHPMWALAEWFRVLRRGGVLVVVERTPSTDAVADGLRPADLLRAAGFSDIRTRDVVLPRGELASSWLRRWTALSAPRRSVTWGRRD